MAKNEDGEIELVLQNRQLIAVFLILAVVLGLMFGMGYMVGRSMAPPVLAENENVSSSSPIVVGSPVSSETEAEPPAAEEEVIEEETVAEAPARPEPAKQEPTKAAPKATPPAKQEKAAPPEPVRTAPQSTAKAAPPPAKSSPAPATRPQGQMPPARSAPIAGRTYLQISATDPAKADELVSAMRRSNFSAIAAPVEGNPALYRVLVGPIDPDAVDSTRQALLTGGFEDARDSIRRVF